MSCRRASVRGSRGSGKSMDNGSNDEASREGGLGGSSTSLSGGAVASRSPCPSNDPPSP
eukprot:CAMPEP_0180336218 /NCGR_PEP_ID=MMETSP0988-20121125/44687_1 /TAXON_ID=697907 /ORGANISM="non described non described, Strain CCMP2293" /LENGTH=58 /DNA_ID=CAMNT_0022324393 /DNA_START=273 /DNA_END=446 /DNA_ORIENTATION=+